MRQGSYAEQIQALLMASNVGTPTLPGLEDQPRESREKPAPVSHTKHSEDWVKYDKNREKVDGGGRGARLDLEWSWVEEEREQWPNWGRIVWLLLVFLVLSLIVAVAALMISNIME